MIAPLLSLVASEAAVVGETWEQCEGQPHLQSKVAAIGLARNVIDESGQRGAGAKERLERVLSLRHEFGIALTDDDVRHVEDELVLTLRDAHHVADDLDGQPRSARRDEVAARACFLQTMNDRLRRGVDIFDVALQHAGREPGRHEFAQSSVSRIVHIDHRAEELVELGRQVGHVGALARLEEVGVSARLDDVGVSGERVVAGAGRQEFGVVLGEVPDRVLAAQRLERRIANRDGFRPETFDVREVDVFELHAPNAMRPAGRGPHGVDAVGSGSVGADHDRAGDLVVPGLLAVVPQHPEIAEPQKRPGEEIGEE